MGCQLAQINVGVLLEPLDTPPMAGFVSRLAQVNAVADISPGFVWRLQTEQGDATAVRAFDDDRVIVNMSVWESLEALRAFVYTQSEHRDALRRRRAWFEPAREAHAALWWVDAGQIPSVAEGEERLTHLREHGPTAHAFTFRSAFPAPAPSSLHS